MFRAARESKNQQAGLGDAHFTLDAVTILAISAGILWAAHDLAFMTVFVPAVLIARTAAFHFLAEKPWPAWAEMFVVLGCALLGGFNDWNSVVRHRIYDYTVPVSRPDLTTIPLWMLLYWGMILRFFFTLARWRRLGPPAAPRNAVWLGRPFKNPYLKAGLELALLIATRQCIYRLYDDAVWSWIPFAGAIGLYAVSLRPSAHEWKILIVMLVGGPIVEALYIQVGGLHRYHLGVFFGVPVSIALWWSLAALIWSDLSFRAASWFANIRDGQHTLPQSPLQ